MTGSCEAESCDFTRRMSRHIHLDPGVREGFPEFSTSRTCVNASFTGVSIRRKRGIAFAPPSATVVLPFGVPSPAAFSFPSSTHSAPPPPDPASI